VVVKVDTKQLKSVTIQALARIIQTIADPKVQAFEFEIKTINHISQFPKDEVVHNLPTGETSFIITFTTHEEGLLYKSLQKLYDRKISTDNET
jgi:hypothetical protein